MKAKMILKTLGLAGSLTISAVAFAHGWDDNSPRYGFPGNPPPVAAPAPAPLPGFINHPAFAESLRLTKEIDERQELQLDRILDGLYERRINPAEFRKLMDEQRAIRAMERQFLADGVLTRFEYQKLDEALDIARRNIFREAHDGSSRPGYGYWNQGGYWNR